MVESVSALNTDPDPIHGVESAKVKLDLECTV